MVGRRHLVAVSALAALTIGGFPAPSSGPAAAAGAAWTTPTSPPRCTTQQADNGDVATCVLMAGPGLPENRGWPVAPFPVPTNQTVTAWVDLTLGMDDVTVAKVQEALNRTAGTGLVADGQFGYLTLTAVKAYQTKNGLTVTGVVNKAMADKLGVQRTTGGTFPPAGWVWNGWGYNGSPALDAYSKQLVGNTAPIGSMRAGQLRSFAAALPLFVGFYTEIQAKGYSIRNGGTWVFRCTASTRKDCNGETKYSLSNHAFGLASDINTVENPMLRYYASGATSACAVPMKTDIPRWVVQSAERWGLYWGGYGWSSGCQSPTQWRSSVSRDPMHFEFNGSPTQAQAILRRNVGSGVCIDVVNALGQPINWCLLKGEVPPAGTRLAVTTKAPAGAAAALVTVTTRDALRNGYFTAEDCAARSATTRSWASGRVRVGRIVNSTVLVPLDAKGRFCIFQSQAFHTSVEVQGFFSPSALAPNGALFTPTAQRTADSRTTTWCTPESACSAPGPVPAATKVLNTASSFLSPIAAWTNVQVVQPGVSGQMSTGVCAGPRPSVAYSALDAGTSRSVVTPAATTEMGVQFCTMSSQAVHHLVDVLGFFASANQGGLGYSPYGPTRLGQTGSCWTERTSGTQRCNVPLAPADTMQLATPAGSTVAVLAVSAMYGSAAGRLTVAACSAFASGTPPPTLLFGTTGDTANLVAVPTDSDGSLCVRTTAGVHVVVHMVGRFSTAGDLRYTPVTPVRVYWTR